MSTTVIKGAEIIDPGQGIHERRDIVIVDGIIDALVRPEERYAGADVVIDAPGLVALPGLIDLHVHLREPGFEWKETIRTGSEAAALGGYTSICAMPNTSPRNDSAEVTRFILERAKEANLVRVLPIGAVTKALEGKEMAPLSELFHAGCVAFSDDGEPISNAGLMRRALEWCLMLGVPISCHEEDKTLTCGGCMNESPRSHRMGLVGMPKVAEDVMVARDIELARATGGKVHICHVSTARSAELIRRAKNDGIAVTAEVTPHHLHLTEDEVEGYNTAAKMSPPLREREDVEALRVALADGTIDAVASDHAPHEEDTKRVEFSRASFGILGLQTSLPLVLELVRAGVISWQRAAEVLSSGPAKCFGLKSGTLGRGSVADIVLVDPTKEWTLGSEAILSKSKNTPFLHKTLVGAAHTVLVEGRMVVKNFSLEVKGHE